MTFEDFEFEKGGMTQEQLEEKIIEFRTEFYRDNPDKNDFINTMWFADDGKYVLRVTKGKLYEIYRN